MESLLPKDHTRYNPSRLPGSALEAINVEDEESKRREEAFGSDQPLPPRTQPLPYPSPAGDEPGHGGEEDEARVVGHPGNRVPVQNDVCGGHAPESDADGQLSRQH